MRRMLLAAALMLAIALLGLNASHAYGQSVDELRSSIGQMRKQLEAQEQRLQQLESEKATISQKQVPQETAPIVLPTMSALAADPAAEPAMKPLSFSIGNNTEITLYGHADLSVDGLSSGVKSSTDANDCQDYSCPGGGPGPVKTRKSFAAVSSNSSYLGVRGVHKLGDASGLPGWSVMLQFETLFEASSTPTERASLGSRDSFVGLLGPYGAIKRLGRLTLLTRNRPPGSIRCAAPSLITTASWVIPAATSGRSSMLGFRTPSGTSHRTGMGSLGACSSRPAKTHPKTTITSHWVSSTAPVPAHGAPAAAFRQGPP